MNLKTNDRVLHNKLAFVGFAEVVKIENSTVVVNHRGKQYTVDINDLIIVL